MDHASGDVGLLAHRDRNYKIIPDGQDCVYSGSRCQTRTAGSVEELLYNKIMTKLGISALVIVVVIGAGVLIFNSPVSEPTPSTDNDGTVAKIETKSNGYVVGHVTIGPNCPVERVDEPCTTPPGAYSSREVVVYGSDGMSVKQKGKIDAQGNFKIALAPGNYFLQISPAGIGPGEKKSVTIKSTETSTVNF